MRVRIKFTPKEREIDGVSLSGLYPGTVRDVSSLLGSWLIAEGYAEPEMRSGSRPDSATAGSGPPAPALERRAGKRPFEA